MWSPQSLLFILCIALSRVTSAAEVIHVAGYRGREVTVSCPYEEGYKSYEKYLCRTDCANNHDVVIRTSEGKTERYSIHDDNKNQVFTVTISDLYPTDAGKYWCGVTRLGMDPYTAEVNLEVEPDSCCDHSTKFQGYEKGSVSISCVYNSQYRNNLKYICRGKQPSTCLQQALITSDNKRKGQFRLTDDKVSRKFTVTITSLTQEDSGSYLCGVHRNTGLDVFSAAELEVKVLSQHTSSVTPLTSVEPSRSPTTQISEQSIKAPTDCLLLTSPAILAALLSLTIALVMVYKYYKLQVTGAGVNMNRNMLRISEEEEMMKAVDIYEFQEDVAYSSLASCTQQSTLHHDDDVDEDQQESVCQILTLTEVYSTCK